MQIYWSFFIKNDLRLLHISKYTQKQDLLKITFLNIILMCTAINSIITKHCMMILAVVVMLKNSGVRIQYQFCRKAGMNKR
ncbi:hypothetical protein ACX27_08985 [Nostoc piscinale CENA21]|uniref:Uncharacterized protein n=1 Tax=Nostoc piscinale CENA21 TaxID=224013 RepID=A0A0M4T323_9NOSO|nr:hypothetical protein ACX27_08985 [Nostoc piscinale CENA21]